MAERGYLSGSKWILKWSIPSSRGELLRFDADSDHLEPCRGPKSAPRVRSGVIFGVRRLVQRLWQQDFVEGPPGSQLKFGQHIAHMSLHSAD